MLAVFARVDPALRKSITFDNDTAFAQHALLRTMRAMTTWFCDAYASWQKGGVENANGRLRRWLPRQIDIDKVSDEEIQDIVMTANLTPRKCLGFKTPFGQSSKTLAKTCKSGSRKALLHLALESRVQRFDRWMRVPRKMLIKHVGLVFRAFACRLWIKRRQIFVFFVIAHPLAQLVTNFRL